MLGSSINPSELSCLNKNIVCVTRTGELPRDLLQGDGAQLGQLCPVLLDFNSQSARTALTVPGIQSRIGTIWVEGGRGGLKVAENQLRRGIFFYRCMVSETLVKNVCMRERVFSLRLPIEFITFPSLFAPAHLLGRIFFPVVPPKKA